MTRGPANPADWSPVPARLETDLEYGGRWTSIRTGTESPREWLWHNGNSRTRAQRLIVDPDEIAVGAGFVDAGGGEECFPQIRGVPDHGIAWCTPWHGTPEEATVVTGYGTLTRRIVSHGDAVRIDYEIEATKDFVHAAHLLLELGEQSRLEFDTGEPPMTVLDWPGPGQQTSGTWPRLPVVGDQGGDDLSRFGAADGTARCAIITGVDRARLVDGDQALEVTWGGDAPTAAMTWRNLEGFPEDGPYRSIGFEPMLGTTAGMDEVGAVPAGNHRWWIELIGRQRS